MKNESTKSKFLANSSGYGTTNAGNKYSKAIHNPAVAIKNSINNNLKFLDRESTATLN